MSKGLIVGLGVLVIIMILAIFHVVHHVLYCRYRNVPGKSHCGKCGHRKICQKYHFKNE